MKLMRLKGMAQTHHQNLQDKLYTDYTLDQYTSLLVEQEWEHRQNRKITNLLRSASFRSNATLDNIDYTTNRGLNLNPHSKPVDYLIFACKHQTFALETLVEFF